MTSAAWSDPAISKTRKSSTSTPRTNPWSMRKSFGDPGQGPQVGRGERPVLFATATAASVNWEAIREYKGQ